MEARKEEQQAGEEEGEGLRGGRDIDGEVLSSNSVEKEEREGKGAFSIFICSSCSTSEGGCGENIGPAWKEVVGDEE